MPEELDDVTSFITSASISVPGRMMTEIVEKLIHAYEEYAVWDQPGGYLLVTTDNLGDQPVRCPLNWTF